MIFSQVVESNYAYIIEAEMLIFMRFKINPFDITNKITLLDLYSYMNILETKIKKEQDSISKKDLTKAFVALRDILIFITMGKEGFRFRT